MDKLSSLGKSMQPELAMMVQSVEEPGRMADLIASNLTLKVPEGWRVNVTLTNHSATASDSVRVGDFATSPTVAPGGVEYFNFTPTKTGSFRVSGRGANEWIHFDVVASNAAPELVMDNVTYAINVARSRG